MDEECSGEDKQTIRTFEDHKRRHHESDSKGERDEDEWGGRGEGEGTEADF